MEPADYWWNLRQRMNSNRTVLEKRYLKKWKKALYKTITWRVLAIIGTVGLLYIVTGNLETSIKAGIGLNLFKMLLYYAHERVWEGI